MRSQILFALLATILLATSLQKLHATTEEKYHSNEFSSKSEKPVVNLRGLSRFLADRPRGAIMTCDKYPSICRTKGSIGPYCCYKQCVNLSTDRLNCGKCGRKCKYSEMCCQGICVNPFVNEKHCGRCNNKCGKGNSCVYGLCSYAN